MGKIKNALYRFMYGRYGSDNLNKALLWVYVALVLLNMVLSLFVESPWYYLIYNVASMALAVYIIFRMFSRNIAKRRRENEKYLGFFKLMKNRFRDRKTHVYKKCPRCGAVLRLPRARGKHTVCCPRCSNRFGVRG